MLQIQGSARQRSSSALTEFTASITNGCAMVKAIAPIIRTSCHALRKLYVLRLTYDAKTVDASQRVGFVMGKTIAEITRTSPMSFVVSR